MSAVQPQKPNPFSQDFNLQPNLQPKTLMDEVTFQLKAAEV